MAEDTRVWKVKCSGHRKRDGQPCENWAIRGGTVCAKHGGRAPQVKVAARRRLAERAVRRTLTDVEVEPLGDPVDALITLAERAVAAERLLTDRIAALEDLAQGDDRAHTEWKLWLDVLDRAHKFTATLASLGLLERKQRLEEEQTKLIADVFRRVFDDPELGLNEDQRRAARAVSARHLRLIEGGAAS